MRDLEKELEGLPPSVAAEIAQAAGMFDAVEAILKENLPHTMSRRFALESLAEAWEWTNKALRSKVDTE